MLERSAVSKEEAVLVQKFLTKNERIYNKLPIAVKVEYNLAKEYLRNDKEVLSDLKTIFNNRLKNTLVECVKENFIDVSMDTKNRSAIAIQAILNVDFKKAQIMGCEKEREIILLKIKLANSAYKNDKGYFANSLNILIKEAYLVNSDRMMKYAKKGKYDKQSGGLVFDDKKL
jgi:hypothetical protein